MIILIFFTLPTLPNFSHFLNLFKKISTFSSLTVCNRQKINCSRSTPLKMRAILRQKVLIENVNITRRIRSRPWSWVSVRQWWHVMNTCDCVMCNIVYCVEKFQKSLHKKGEIQTILVPISLFEINKIWSYSRPIKIKIVTSNRENFVEIKYLLPEFLTLNNLKRSRKNSFFLKRVKN